MKLVIGYLLNCISNYISNYADASVVSAVCLMK